MMEAYRVYIFVVARVADGLPRVGCVLAKSQREAVNKALANVLAEFGPDAVIQNVAPITPVLDLRRFARTEIIRALCVCDKALLACVVIDDLTAEMLDVIEYQKKLVGVLQKDTEERLRIFDEQQGD